MSCGAENEANDLMEALLNGVEVDIPNIDLDDVIYQFPTTDIRIPITRLKNSDLTTGQPGGAGTFDVLMQSTKNHLKEEYDANRITGAEYTKAYVALTSAAMGNSVQYLLQRDQAYWTAQLAQIQAIKARVDLAMTKVEYVKIKLDAFTAKAQYATSKINLAKVSNDYCLSKHELETMRPLQAADLSASTDVREAQKVGLDADNIGKTYTNDYLLPAQKDNLISQGALIKEQTEAARGQTRDTHTDGSVILGSIGKQKDLYTQQISSYKRDSQNKAARIFSDAWITMKTIDEGVLPPDNFANASLNAVLAKLKTDNELV